MAAKKSTSPSTSLSLAEIEKNIARLTAELHKARTQKVSDAEKNLQQAKTALAVATDKANQSGAAGVTAAKSKKARAELESQQQLVAAAEDNLYNAKLALEIATESAKEAAQARAKLGAPAKKKEKAVKADKKLDKKSTGKQSIKEAKLDKKSAKKTPSVTTADSAPGAAAEAPRAKAERKSAEKPKPVTTPEPETTASERLPKPKPVDPEPMGTAVTIPPASESSLLPEHGFTTLIEPRDNPLPKPQPV